MAVKTKSDAQAFRLDLEKALQDVASKWGLKDMSAGSISYDCDQVGGVKFTVKGFGEGRVDAKFARAVEEWNFYATHEPTLQVSWLGKSFKTDRGQVLTIQGWCNRKRKDKILLTDGGSREYKAPVALIAQYKSQLS
jgi:hypothetical protein